MKTIKYISILVLSACMVALFSCTEDEIVKKGTLGDGHTLRIELTTDANREVSPLSKASADDPQEKVTDLNILIYENGTLVENESQYINSGAALSDLSELSTKEDKASTPFTLTDIEPGDKVVYVVANAGQSLINSNDVATEDGLKNKKFTMNGVRPQFVMFAEGQSFNVANNPSITSSLKRIYAMVTVKMNVNTNSNVQIIPQSVQLKNIPLTGRLSDKGGELEEGNKVELNDGSESTDGEILKREDYDGLLSLKHENATPLFLYENRQKPGKNNGDERTKTPWYFSDEAITMPEIIKTDKRCSYIEIKANCIKDNKPTGPGSGPVTYRFFLGKDAVKDFDVQRNWYYKVTLTLTGNGGVDEGTWRVEADLKGELTIPKVYVSYNAGSVSQTIANGDYENARVVSQDNKISVQLDQKTGNVTITANETNTSDYESRTFKYDYYVDNEYRGTAEVVQVPRLVDPIAIYRKANSTQSFDVNVREYDKDTKSYLSLVSDGPWSATIESYYPINGGCWFDIYPLDGDQNVTEDANGVIKGTENVSFGYKPLSKNDKQDRVSSGNLNDFSSEQTDGARYGVILVKYHNNQCEHRIYVRQGYQPTTIAGTVWSMFNCLGKQSNGKQAYTEYPTQTGWLFHGGSAIAMHPCDPGYEVEPTSKGVLCSDGQYRSFGSDGFSFGVSNWVSGGNDSRTAKQGPCPSGYKLVNDLQLHNMCQSSGTVITTTGFVYDDDPVTGWHYSGKNMVAETDNNSCNPAKGTLFVQKNNGASIFFTHGKGVMTEHIDNNLIDEIGIGHRTRWTDGYLNSHWNVRNGVLKYWEYTDADYGELKEKEHTYGAFYWAAARFDDTRLSRVCLSYNILTQQPYYVDNIDNSKHQGIHVSHHANFIRCVRDK